MEPENDGFQKESPFPGTSFQVPCEISGVYIKDCLAALFSQNDRLKMTHPTQSGMDLDKQTDCHILFVP